MQKIKIKILGLLLMSALISVSAYAQKGQHHGAQKSLDRLSEELDLSEDQVTEIKEIKDNYRNSMKASREQMKQDMESVLTEDQKNKLKQIKQEARAEKMAFRKELKEYRNENIKPVLLEQRKKLEAYISEEDKGQIEALRAQRKANHEQMKGMKKEKGKEGSKRAEVSPEKRELMKDQKEKVKLLAEKYDDEISQLLSEIEEEKEGWKKDIGEMKEESNQTNPHKNKARRHKGLKANKMGKGQFLLMNPEPSSVSKKLDRNVGSFKVFPVPSSDSNTIEYEVKKAANIQIVMMDSQGNIIREISNEYKEAGVYEETVNISNLSSEQYYYAILNDKGIVSKKFTVIK